MSSQLLQKGILTSKYLNDFLRNKKDLEKNNVYYVLREDQQNNKNLTVLSNFKPLLLDLARQFDAEIINHAFIVHLQPLQHCQLHDADKRLILCLDNSSRFLDDNLHFTPESGDLLFTNSNLLEIDNSNQTDTVLLVIDFKEFKLC